MTIRRDHGTLRDYPPHPTRGVLPGPSILKNNATLAKAISNSSIRTDSPKTIMDSDSGNSSPATVPNDQTVAEVALPVINKNGQRTFPRISPLFSSGSAALRSVFNSGSAVLRSSLTAPTRSLLGRMSLSSKNVPSEGLRFHPLITVRTTLSREDHADYEWQDTRGGVHHEDLRPKMFWTAEEAEGFREESKNDFNLSYNEIIKEKPGEEITVKEVLLNLYQNPSISLHENPSSWTPKERENFLEPIRAEKAKRIAEAEIEAAAAAFAAAHEAAQQRRLELLHQRRGLRSTGSLDGDLDLLDG